MEKSRGERWVALRRVVELAVVGAGGGLACYACCAVPA
jgi:hypothetical protein